MSSPAVVQPRPGQVWVSRWAPRRYVAVLDVRQRDGRVRFAPVQVSDAGGVTRDKRHSRPLWDTPDGLRRAFQLTHHTLHVLT